jgi:hypothetical protein
MPKDPFIPLSIFGAADQKKQPFAHEPWNPFIYKTSSYFATAAIHPYRHIHTRTSVIIKGVTLKAETA